MLRQPTAGRKGLMLFAWRKNGKPYAVVITDLGMPYIDGKKVASAIKEASTDVAVILLTGWGYRLGDDDLPPHVDAVVSKPSRIGDLRTAMAHCQRSIT